MMARLHQGLEVNIDGGCRGAWLTITIVKSEALSGPSRLLLTAGLLGCGLLFFGNIVTVLMVPAGGLENHKRLEYK